MKTVLICCLIFLSGLSAHAAGDTLVTDFRKADSIAAVYAGHSLHVKELTGKLTSSLSTEEEKFRAIYKWVCDNIAYDYWLHRKNQRKREKLETPEERNAWNIEITMEMIRTLYEKRRTVCTGYAYIIKKMAAQAGIESVIVDGYGRTVQANIGGDGIPNHSWNAVKLNGTWYLCDATWSSGAWDTQSNVFAKRYDDAYFLANPALFIRNHYPLDSTWTLMKTYPSLNEFLNGPIIYSKSFGHNLGQLYPATFDVTVNKGEPFLLRFKADTAMDNVLLFVKGPGGISSASPVVSQTSEDLYELKHTFNARGLHTVHVLFKIDYLMTYSVLVK